MKKFVLDATRWSSVIACFLKSALASVRVVHIPSRGAVENPLTRTGRVLGAGNAIPEALVSMTQVEVGELWTVAVVSVNLLPMRAAGRWIAFLCQVPLHSSIPVDKWLSRDVSLMDPAMSLPMLQCYARVVVRSTAHVYARLQVRVASE